MNLKNLLCIAFLAISHLAYAQLQCSPLIGCGNIEGAGLTIGNGNTVFCEGEEVTIENTTPLSQQIDTTIIDWGDGTIEKLIGDQRNSVHTYNFPEDTCLMAISAFDNTQALLLEINISVIRLCEEGASVSCFGTNVKIKVNPVARIEPPSKLCARQEIRLSNMTCENGDSILYTLSTPDGELVDAEIPSIIYEKGGIYPLTLTAENECGTDVANISLNVLDIPTTETTFNVVPISACLPVNVNLNSSTDFATNYDWRFTPDRGVTFIDSTFNTFPDPIVQITEADTFQIDLISENLCGRDTSSLMLPVFDIPRANLSVLSNNTFCEMVTYTPDVSYTGTIETIDWTFENGTPATSTALFPQDIQFTTVGTHQILGLIDGPCGMDTIREFITILDKTPIVFNSIPTNVCNTSDVFSIEVNVPGGEWEGDCVDENGVFDPTCMTEAGLVNVTYCVGQADCESCNTLSFEVEVGLAIDITTPKPTCVSDDLVTLEFETQAGRGSWSGIGVIDSLNGVIDPAIVGIGEHSYVYRLENEENGCITEASTVLNIVSNPSLPFLDSFVTCQSETPQNLEVFIFGGDLDLRGDGEYTYDGPGVTADGMFNSEALDTGTYSINVTRTTLAGCDTTATFNMTVTEMITAAIIGGNRSVCKSQERITLVGQPAGGEWKGEAIDAVTGEIDLTKLTAEITYDYQYVFEQNFACSSEAEVRVAVIGGEGVNAGLDQYICETATATILEGPELTDGQWEGEGLIVEDSNLVNLSNLVVDSLYTYTFTQNNLPSGCNTDTKTLFVASQPSANFTHDAVTCIDLPVNFNHVIEADQFNWIFSDGTSSSDPIPDKAFAQKDDFQIILETSTFHPLEINQILCSNRDTSFIMIQEPPRDLGFEIEVLGDNCGPVSIDLTNNSSGDDLQFTWLIGTDTLSTDFTPSTQTLLSGIEDTTYTILMAVNNNCGDNSQMEEVEVLARTKADFGITFNNPCSGDSLFVNNVSTGSPTDFRWTFSTGETFEMENPPVVIPFTDTLPRDVLITLITENQCNIDTITEVVVVNPTNVQALINTSAQTLCLGDTLFLEAFTTPQAPFHWELEDGNAFLTREIQHVFQTVDTFDVVLFTEGCGFDSMKTEVIVLPLPTATIATAAAICEDAAAEFNVTTNAEGHQLFFGDGDSTNLTIGEHIYNEAGVFPIQLVATSIAGCKRTIEDSILVRPLPIPEIDIASDGLCVGEMGTFQSLSQNSESCQWKFGDDNFGNGCEVQHSYDTSENFNVTLISSAGGCKDSISTIIFVRATPTAAFQATVLNDCTPATVQLTNQSTIATGIQWQLPDGTTPNISNLETTLTNASNTTIQLIATNEGLCFDTIVQNLTIFASPEITLQLDENCLVDEGIDLTVSTTPQSFTTLISPIDTMAGTFFAGLLTDTYQINTISDDGCQKDTMIQINEIQELQIEINPDSQQIRLGEEAIIEVVPNMANVNFSWFPMDEVLDNTFNQIRVFPEESTTYEVIVMNEANCSKSTTAFVAVTIDRQRGVYIPNTFTPDGSLRNDVFRIRVNNPAVAEILYFNVFDKNGTLVFGAENYSPNNSTGDWNGEYKGDKAEMGAYTYQALVSYTDGHEEPFVGSILLIR